MRRKSSVRIFHFLATNMNDVYSITVEPGEENCRIDKFLAIHFQYFSRSKWSRCIECGGIYVNRKQIDPDYRVNSNDIISVHSFPVVQESTIVPQDIKFCVLHECDSYIIVNKHPGLVVHPGSGCMDGTLVNGLLYRYPQLKLLPRAGLVHRLDKKTSGLLIVAKNDYAYTYLTEKMLEKQIEKRYWAIVWGKFTTYVSIEKNISRDPVNRTKMITCREGSGRTAKTHCFPHTTNANSNMSLIECILDTGRTHQIRVHLSSINFPLVGDETYSSRRLFLSSPIKRQCLHARSLTFTCPDKQSLVTYNSPIPNDMEYVIGKINAGFRK
ncbi:RluA family pseudouridine synthase [Candidatus Ichthyocystis sparus]|uniref:RluA family pseudouridine synthase n=1 Tax=Candidatus Ichthyocystis sparus TaxID=1561004 RepID=UPI000A9068F5|nr:RluA family pseudouridine synthase [Candidatus Ichthyocystis sparus]